MKKSTITAVYTCAVKVGNANVSIEFNRCLSGATRSRPQDISVTMTKSGDYDQISVYRTPDFGYVVRIYLFHLFLYDVKMCTFPVPN